MDALEPRAAGGAGLDLSDVRAAASALSRAEFARRFPAPFLLELEEGAAPGSRGKAPVAPGLQTSHPPRANFAQAPMAGRPVRLHEVRKRAASNPFAHMITAGRAENNDIVVADRSVSKFHASFVPPRNGGVWLVLDSSLNGTWLEGERLAPRQPYPIRPGCLLVLAETVSFVFLTPERLHDRLVSSPGAARARALRLES